MGTFSRHNKQPSTSRSALWTAAKIILAVVLVGIVISQTTLADLAALINRIVLPWIPASIFAYWTITVLTAWRYWILVDRKLPLGQAMGLTVVQTVIGNFVASSAGAVSYVVLLRGRHQIELSQGITSLVLARFGDLLALTVALAASSIVLWAKIESLHWPVLVLLSALTGVIIALLLVFSFRQPIVVAGARMLHWCQLDRFEPLQRLIFQLETLAAQNPERLRQKAIPFLGLSFSLMLCSFAFSYSMIHLFGIPLDTWAILFSMAIIQLLAVIPIQVFGGLGVYEVTALYLYGLLGVAAPIVIPLVISSRLYLWVLNLTLLLYLPFESRLVSDEDLQAAQEI